MRRLKKLLVNTYEKDTLVHLKKCEERHKINVNTKVRVADVFDVNNQNTNSSLFQYALMSHFDFLITESSDDTPLFAVEFDELHHFIDDAAIKRDMKKKKLCELFEFPLLRITESYYNRTYGAFTLLEYFIEYWFCDRDIQKAYETGQISAHDYYDPSLTLALPGYKGKMPFWIAKEERISLGKYNDNGLILERLPSIIHGKDSENNCQMFACIKVNKTFGVMAQNSMLSQQFPIIISELLDDLLTIAIKNLIDQALVGKTKLQSIDVIIKKAKEFWANHQEPKFEHSAEWFKTAVQGITPISETDEIND